MEAAGWGSLGLAGGLTNARARPLTRTGLLLFLYHPPSFHFPRAPECAAASTFLMTCIKSLRGKLESRLPDADLAGSEKFYSEV